MVERGLAERGIVITSANGTHAIYTHTLATLYARSRKTHTQALIRTIYTYAGRRVLMKNWDRGERTLVVEAQ